MRNKLTSLLICALMFLCPASGISASDEANIKDLQDLEKGIQFLEDKLARREIGLEADEEYKRVRATEMAKCAGLKSEIWALRDSARALVAKINKLAADKKKVEADITKLAATYRSSEENIKATAATISARDTRFKDLKAAGEKDNNSRGEKISKLKEDLRVSAGKVKSLQDEKSKIDSDLKDKDAEYKAGTEKLQAIKKRIAAELADSKSAKKAPPAKEIVPVKDESADIKKNMDELMVIAGKWETARQKLVDEIAAATTMNRSLEEKISALEKEDELKSRDLSARSEDLETAKKKTLARIEKLKKKASLANVRLRAARAADIKLDDDIKKAALEKRRAEKEFKVKTDDLKVRISVLMEGNGQYGLLDESDEAGQGKKELSRGEELTIKLDKMFDAIKDENARLAAENKNTQAKLKRAEQAAKKARRKAEQAAKIPEELKETLNRERVDTHFNLAVVYEKNGLYRDAEREYLKCLRIDPKDAGVHYNIGILYDDKLNNNSKAMYHYLKFLALRPMGETAERVRDWITKLELENRLGKEMR